MLSKVRKTLIRYKNVSPIVVLVLIVFASGLGNRFVSDDIPTILENQDIGSWTYIEKVFPTITFASLLSLEHKFFGINPTGYHVAGILMHLINVLLVYKILKRISSESTALVASAVFGLHPLAVEAVTWTSGNIYVLYALFSLLSIDAYISFLEKRKQEYAYLTLIYALLAFLTSEKALILPLLLIATRKIFDVRVKEKLLWIGIILIWGGMVVMNVQRVPQRIADFSQDVTDTETTETQLIKLAQVPVSISEYAKLAIFPRALTLYHSDLSMTWTELGIRTSLGIGIGILGFVLWLKDKLTGWAIMWTLITLLPTIVPLDIAWIVAERYIYLGLVGIGTLAGILWYKVANKDVSKILAVLIFAGLCLRTSARVHDWRNEDTLWLSARKFSKRSAQNHNNLGDLYARHGNYEQAIQEFGKAIELKPSYAEAYYNLGNTYLKVGDVQDAKETFETVLKLSPSLWQTYVKLAQIYEVEGDLEKAESILTNMPTSTIETVRLKQNLLNELKARKSD